VNGIYLMKWTKFLLMALLVFTNGSITPAAHADPSGDHGNGKGNQGNGNGNGGPATPTAVVTPQVR